mmetsp:Transcript_61254/g.144710  ORF Transcript_61254/g.144710 Transcript_61254/m.144710 type:complete len:90 (+) Transcript_61254:3-272(+)
MSYDEFLIIFNILSMVFSLWAGVFALRGPKKDRRRHEACMLRAIRSSLSPALMRVFVLLQLYTWIPITRHLRDGPTSPYNADRVRTTPK